MIGTSGLKPLGAQGNTFAQFILGLMYDNGRGVPKDDKEAIRWYRLAAQQGYAWAESKLGAMYGSGRGVPQNYGEAVKWFRLAAEQGDALGEFSLGVLAGLLTNDALWQALLPAGLYIVLHLIEGETLTPMLLAKRFTLNPVLVIISLVFWFWMWGIPGAILSVPMLAITKIICDRVRPLAAFGHFLEG